MRTVRADSRIPGAVAGWGRVRAVTTLRPPSVRGMIGAMLRSITMFCLVLGLCATASAQGFLPTSGYQRQRASGFTVYVNPAVDQHGKQARAGVALVKSKLAEVAARLPKKALEQVRQVPVFVEWKSESSSCLDYHRDASGLTHVELNLDKLKAVEIGALSCFVERVKGDEPMALLRELAIAYQDRVIGWEASEVVAAWSAAKESGKYALVPFVAGGMREPPGMASAQLFFAEVTESLYGHNDYFPFHRQDLVRYDPAACAMAAKAWGAPSRVCSDEPAPTPKPKPKAKKKRSRHRPQ